MNFSSGVICPVCDSYDLYNCVENIWCKELYDLVMQRKDNGAVIIRPDSGDPSKVVIKVRT